MIAVPTPMDLVFVAMAESIATESLPMSSLSHMLSRKGQRVFQAANYLPAHPEIAALQADLKPGGGRFKRANYLSPEILFDKSNEWADYFEKEFLR